MSTHTRLSSLRNLRHSFSEMFSVSTVSWDLAFSQQNSGDRRSGMCLVWAENGKCTSAIPPTLAGQVVFNDHFVKINETHYNVFTVGVCLQTIRRCAASFALVACSCLNQKELFTEVLRIKLWYGCVFILLTTVFTFILGGRSHIMYT